MLESCIYKIYSFRNLNSPYNNKNLKVQIPYFSPNKVKTSDIYKEEDFFKPNIAKMRDDLYNKYRNPKTS